MASTEPVYERLGAKVLSLPDVIAQSVGFMGPVFSSAFVIPLVVGVISASGKGGGVVLLFVGFETAANLAEETPNPRREIPIAVLTTAGIATVFYVLATYVEVAGFHYSLKAITAAAGAPLFGGDRHRGHRGGHLRLVLQGDQPDDLGPVAGARAAGGRLRLHVRAAGQAVGEHPAGRPGRGNPGVTGGRRGGSSITVSL
jgi:hypothetical protein